MKKYILRAAMLAVISASPLAMAAANNILSVHILDQQSGKPASNVEVVLEQKNNDGWQ